jgi:hypothetical protein
VAWDQIVEGLSMNVRNSHISCEHSEYKEFSDLGKGTITVIIGGAVVYSPARSGLDLIIIQLNSDLTHLNDFHLALAMFTEQNTIQKCFKTWPSHRFLGITQVLSMPSEIAFTLFTIIVAVTTIGDFFCRLESHHLYSENKLPDYT